jgi:tRNA (guanine37-N1)-methyltransferase
MHISIITIFPDIFRAYLGESLMGRARERGILTADVIDLRDFAADRHGTVDDTPYGGGPGMVMKPEPIERAVESIKSDGHETFTISVSPQGQRFTQAIAERFSREHRRLLFLCGRYEGVDERVIDELVDEEISIGDYVMTGGELAALVIIDASVRLLEGVVGDERSLEDESFSWGILDYPQYTRPPVWRDRRVPDVLLSGNHAEIHKWRRREALRRTFLRRPDLLREGSLSDADKRLLSEIKEEDDGFREGG